MEYGVHVPQIAFGEPDWTLEGLAEYVEIAERLDYRFLCANDHLLFSRPWLDGPTALASLLSRTDMTLATTIVNPVVRDVVVLAKTLSVLDLLSGGRLVVGVGPGSSERDYEAVGIDFEERWARFDESVRALRSLLHGRDAIEGEFYSTVGIDLEPEPVQEPGPPIWIGSWDSTAGLRRVAHLGDGWLASGYHASPGRFETGEERLDAELRDAGRSPDGFPNAMATVFVHVTDDAAEARAVVAETLAPALERPAAELADRLPICSVETCARTLAAYRAAGVDRVYLWPVRDELDQLRTVHTEVIPRVGGSAH